jgi:hypothetical protein
MALKALAAVLGGVSATKPRCTKVAFAQDSAASDFVRAVGWG